MSTGGVPETKAPWVWAPVRWLVWVGYLASWTAALLTTEPVRWEEAVLPPAARLPSAKFLHVGAYLVLAILTGWLRAPGWWRWLLLALLFVHAGGTEFGQQFVAERHPSAWDVGLDGGGILLGLFISWRWWRARSPESPTKGQDR